MIMRKTATNTFSKGLIKDLHPLNTPNTVLTNALNASLVTFDGNEYILQNDMGNAKVDSAKLPKGYIPIGIKEYGGIIYVASYNPLTAKSQIGSFPSPERQIATTETSTSFSFGSNAKIDTTNSYKRLDIVDETGELYKLNPGDRFVIASSGISTILGLDGILKVHIGVVDKENNVTYIEEDLTTPYIVESFTADTETEKWQSFVSKTSGYLSIILELCTIDSYTLTRDIELYDKSVDITTGNATFSLTLNGKSRTSSNIIAKQFQCEYNTTSSNGTVYSSVSSDPSTTPEQLKFTNIPNNEVLSYDVTPICDYGDLSSFKISGKIDFSILGTGYFNFNEWRYYSDLDNGYLRINWGLDYDPIKFIKIKSATFTFYDVQNNMSKVKFGDANTNGADSNTWPSYYTCSTQDNYNGNFSEKIAFETERTKIGIWPKKLYFVKIEFTFVTGTQTISKKRIYRFLYTTGIFNEDYIKHITTDFSSLSISIPLTINPQFTVSNTNITSTTSAQVLSSTNRFADIEGDYSVNGSLVVNLNYDDSLYVGSLNYKIGTASDETVGLSIKTPDSYTYTIEDAPKYINAEGVGPEIEKAIRRQRLNTTTDDPTDTKNYRACIDNNGSHTIVGDTISITLTPIANTDNSFSFSLNGALWRGLYADANTDITKTITGGQAYVLTPAVTSVEDLYEYVNCSIEGATSDITGTNTSSHLQIKGTVPMLTYKDTMISAVIDGKKGQTVLCTYSNKGKTYTVLSDNTSQENGFNSSLANSTVNSTVNGSLHHPIVFIIGDGGNENNSDVSATGWSEDATRAFLHSANFTNVGEFMSGGEYTFEGETINSICCDYILMAWQIAPKIETETPKYSLINIGGILAHRSKKFSSGQLIENMDTPDKLTHAESFGCEYEMPRMITYKSPATDTKYLTILDIVYNYLKNIYIAQWSTDLTGTYTIPNANEATYHDKFAEDFTVTGKYDIYSDSSKLILLTTNGDTKIYLNSDTIKTWVTTNTNSGLTSEEVTEIINSWNGNNVTVSTANFKDKTHVTPDLSFTYSIGGSFNIYSWLVQVSAATSNAVSFDSNKVYVPNSFTSSYTNDGVLNDYRTTEVYMIDSSGNYVPYDGKVRYNMGTLSSGNTDYVTSQTSSKFLKVFRPSDKTRKAVLCINPASVDTINRVIRTDLKDSKKNILYWKWSRNNIIFPGSNIFTTT